MPTNLGVKGSWMTGTIPVSVSCISSAADSVELDGQQHTGFLVMISLTFIEASPESPTAKTAAVISPAAIRRTCSGY
jgi:hypothetical protein